MHDAAQGRNVAHAILMYISTLLTTYDCALVLRHALQTFIQAADCSVDLYSHPGTTA